MSANDDLKIAALTLDTALGGQVTLSGSNPTYTAPANGSGLDSFYYLVSDGQSGSVYKLVLNSVTFTATGSMATFRYAVLYNATPAAGGTKGAVLHG